MKLKGYSFKLLGPSVCPNIGDRVGSVVAKKNLPIENCYIVRWDLRTPRTCTSSFCSLYTSQHLFSLSTFFVCIILESRQDRLPLPADRYTPLDDFVNRKFRSSLDYNPTEFFERMRREENVAEHRTLPLFSVCRNYFSSSAAGIYSYKTPP